MRTANVIALGVSGALLAIGAAAGPVIATSTSISLHPLVGPPTSKVSATGSGFGSSENVVVDFGTAQVAATTATSTGSFSTVFAVPKSALPGTHTVKATGQTSGITATATFLVRTDWTKFRFGLANTGYNPYENVVSPTNVSKLTQAWTGSIGGAIDSSPAVANGVAYVGAENGKVYAFSANGTTSCSGTPKVCQPLWTAATGTEILSSPAVANGVVYIGSNDHNLYAFSAGGTTNCSGTPKVCRPLWIDPTGGAIATSPAIQSGTVYIGSDDGNLYAFSASGTTGCTGVPKTCSPLWTGTIGYYVDESSPAVSNGVVYIGAEDDEIHAFSASGTTNCSGAPKVCQALWTGATGGFVGTPALAKGIVYVGSDDGSLYAFDAAGTTNCSGAPKTCMPLWTADVGASTLSSPAVANGIVYVGPQSSTSALYAFSAAGTTGCSGTPKTCNPLWSGSAGSSEEIYTSPAVANGVVYVISNFADAYAFSASGTINCSGAPKICTPLWSDATSDNDSSPAVADGMLYFGSNDGNLYAFAP